MKQYLFLSLILSQTTIASGNNRYALRSRPPKPSLILPAQQEYPITPQHKLKKGKKKTRTLFLTSRDNNLNTASSATLSNEQYQEIYDYFNNNPLMTIDKKPAYDTNITFNENHKWYCLHGCSQCFNTSSERANHMTTCHKKATSHAPAINFNHNQQEFNALLVGLINNIQILERKSDPFDLEALNTVKKAADAELYEANGITEEIPSPNVLDQCKTLYSTDHHAPEKDLVSTLNTWLVKLQRKVLANTETKYGLSTYSALETAIEQLKNKNPILTDYTSTDFTNVTLPTGFTNPRNESCQPPKPLFFE